MLDVLKNFLFPRVCVGCGDWGEYLCADCVNFIKTQDEPICPQCFKPSLYGFTHFRCRTTYALNGLTSVFVHQGVVKEVIRQLKYEFVHDLAETILEMVLSFIGEDKAFSRLVTQKNVCLVPVPLYWSRKNWRGFNQVELLGKMMAQKLGIKFIPDLLIRIRNTRPQTKLKAEKRFKNIKGAFKLNEKYKQSTIWPFDNLAIVLFDDVWTTGATLRECGQVLKRNKFKKVWGLTLARKLFEKKKK